MLKNEKLNFKKIYKNGKKKVGKYAVIYCINKNNILEKHIGNNIGVVASKKVGNAVKRNRIKRLMREAIREYSKEENRFFEIALISKTNIVDINKIKMIDLKNDIKYLLKERVK